MNKKIKLLVLIVVIGVIGGFIYYVFKEVVPYDDTKKLYISCNSHHKSYSVLSSDKVNFQENDDKCALSIEVRNVDRQFIKLKTEKYFYSANNDGNVDEKASPKNEIYVEPDKTTVVYSLDKSTKFEFEYK